MLGVKIKNYLTSKGISQTFICSKTNLSPSKLSAMLNGDRKIMAEEYFLICKALNLSCDYFKEYNNEAS